MRKSFLFLLFSIMTVFLIAGCAEDTTNGGGNSDNSSTGNPGDNGTGNNVPEELKSLLGTYEVTFFGSQVTNVRDGGILVSMADMFYISNDCTKAKELYPDVIGVGNKNNCTVEGQSTLLEGVVLFSYVNNQLAVTSRMQMEGGTVDMSPSDKYQYTEYYKTSDFTTLSGKGVKGWNYDDASKTPSATATDFPESPYTVSINADGIVRVDMTLVGKVVPGIATVDAKNTIILRKLSDDTTPLENKIMQPFQ